MNNIQRGEGLSLWLGKASSPEIAKQIAKDIGYNDSPFFGANKRKVKIMGELVMVNTAIAISGVNHVYRADIAKEIVDAFLAKSRTHIFSFLEARFPDFSSVYEKRMEQYFNVLKGERPGMGLAFAFLIHMGKNPIDTVRADPIGNIAVQMAIALRFEASLKKVIGAVLHSASVSASPKAASPSRSEGQKKAELGTFIEEVAKWPDKEAQLAALRAIEQAVTGETTGPRPNLDCLTVAQVRRVSEFLENFGVRLPPNRPG